MEVITHGQRGGRSSVPLLVTPILVHKANVVIAEEVGAVGRRRSKESRTAVRVVRSSSGISLALKARRELMRRSSGASTPKAKFFMLRLCHDPAGKRNRPIAPLILRMASTYGWSVETPEG